MDAFRIVGGKKLNGEIEGSGSKNSALPVLFATLLSEETHHIQRVPKLADMDSTMSMLLHLGARIEQKHSGVFASSWLVDAKNLDAVEAPYDLVRKMRASILCVGPLLARCGKARASLPGGCAIGTRPIDLHLMGFEKLGAQVETKMGYVEASVPAGKKLKGAQIHFPIVSVGATENVMMAACLAEGTTVLENAALEPEIVALAEALVSMGAKIHGHGSSQIVIDGVSSLGAMDFKIPVDRIETATYLIAAQLCGGSVKVKGAVMRDLVAVVDSLRESGANVEELEDGIVCRSSDKIKPVDVVTTPFPGFPTDVQAQWMALMTQAEGASVITENIFENRFMHVPELGRLGADLTVRGRSVHVQARGRTGLEGAPVMATDLRASASLVLAGLVAKGETLVKRIYHLDRGYESMEQKLRSLGAEVSREAES